MREVFTVSCTTGTFVSPDLAPRDRVDLGGDELRDSVSDTPRICSPGAPDLGTEDHSGPVLDDTLGPVQRLGDSE